MRNYFFAPVLSRWDSTINIVAVTVVVVDPSLVSLSVAASVVVVGAVIGVLVGGRDAAE